MRREVAESYYEVAREIARNFVGRSVDPLGLDREDYVAELMEHAYKAWRAHGFRCGFGLSSERPYVYKSLWQRARQLQRKCKLRARYRPLSLIADPLAEIDTEARLEDREVLRLLDKYLSGVDRRMLEAAGEGWIYELRQQPGWDARRLLRARVRARDMLDLDAHT
jgi:hypothetical protein